MSNKDKEFVCNDCNLCDYGVKQYLCARNKFMFIKVFSCINAGMSLSERKKCMNNKMKCAHFKPEETSKEVQLSDIKEAMNEVDYQLKSIAYKLDLLSQKED